MVAADKKHLAREALLEAARSLFVDKSYDSVSTRELAEKAGVNLAAIQYHFGSKAQLFVEAVRTLMCAEDCRPVREMLEAPLASREEAVDRLCTFVHYFLDDLVHGDQPQPCRMMFREIFSDRSKDSEMYDVLVSAMVDDFSRPMSSLLAGVLRPILPNASDERLMDAVHCIVGQCFFFLTHRPFLMKLRGYDCGVSPHFERTVQLVCEFSLRGLGCEESLVQCALAKQRDEFKSQEFQSTSQEHL